MNLPSIVSWLVATAVVTFFVLLILGVILKMFGKHKQADNIFNFFRSIAPPKEEPKKEDKKDGAAPPIIKEF